MLVSRELLSNICKEAKIRNQKVVFTNGCFDIIHSGHVKYLADSKKLGDILIIGLNSDDSVRRLKGESRPLNNQTDRAEVLSAMKSVDYVCIFEEDTPYNLISAIIPDLLTKGGDYLPENIAGGDVVTDNGGQIVIIKYVDGKSTTNIIEKMKN
jgi:rfaE bifunctional protein nucleotidyltransferase chain/domain